MPQSRYKSIAEIATHLSQLQDQIQLMYAKFEYPKEGDPRRLMDVRPYSLGTIQSETALNVMILNLLVAVEDGKMPAELFRSIIGVSDKSISLEYVSYQMSNYLRLAYVTMVQFRMENLITNILAVFDREKAKNRRYYHKAKALLEILQLDDANRTLDKLMVLQNIRNGLHSNGKHNNSNLNVTINGCQFVFEKGKDINCAGWEHIIIALESALIIIEKILKVSKVKSLHELISIDYTEPADNTENKTSR